jgi:hypothetical protein
LLLDIFGMASHVVDQILPGLKPFAGESPEEGSAADLVSLHEVVINQTLIHIFDCLKNYLIRQKLWRKINLPTPFFAPNFSISFRLKTSFYV